MDANIKLYGVMHTAMYFMVCLGMADTYGHFMLIKQANCIYVLGI